MDAKTVKCATCGAEIGEPCRNKHGAAVPIHGARAVDAGAVPPELDAERAGKCGHAASGNGFTYVCDLRRGHSGLHGQRTQLRDRVETTNWGSDGLAPWATKDSAGWGRA